MLEQLQKLKLESEEVNPVYERLLDALIKVRIEYESLLPKKNHLESEITKLDTEIDDLMARQAEYEVAAFALNRSREEGLTTLMNDRILGLVSLDRTRQTEYERLELERLSQLDSLEKERADQVASLKRKTALDVGALERQVTQTSKTYDLIAEKFNSAQLAKSEEESDVKIGARAVVPDGPVRSNMALNIVIALTAGILISFVLVLVLELRAWISQHDLAKTSPTFGNRHKMVLEDATLLGRYPKNSGPDPTDRRE
jgi:uncharacterized protein involved in exopolysaccharide biosynthesis